MIGTTPVPPAPADAGPVRWHRPLVLLAAVTALAAVSFTVLSLVDDQQVTGVDRWLKPWKFAVSIMVYSLTVAWMVRLVRVHRRTATVAAGVAAVALGVEIAIIVTQAGRGTTSHFNEDSALDGALFGVMGLSIVAVWLATLALALVLLREDLPGAGLAVGLRWGLGIAVFAMLAGVLMLDPLHEMLQVAAGGPDAPGAGGHTVGAADGGPGLPLVGWSTTDGDLRVGHFVGMHALQLLPLAGWLLDRSGRWSDAQRRGLMRVAGGGWLGLVLIVLWQAVRAEPLLRPGLLTLSAVALLALAVLGLALAITRRRQPADAHRPGVTSPLS